MSIFTHLEYLSTLATNAQNLSNKNDGTLTDIDILNAFADNDADIAFFGGPIRCYTKFGITNRDVTYSIEEHNFRLTCLQEESKELIDALAENNMPEVIDAVVDLLFFAIGTTYRAGLLFKSLFAYKHHINTMAFLINERARLDGTNRITAASIILEELVNNFGNRSIEDNQLDYQTHIDYIIAGCVAVLLNQYDREMILTYYERVTQANLSKELGSLPKRGSFSIDLKKPEGWQAPNFDGLCFFVNVDELK